MNTLKMRNRLVAGVIIAGTACLFTTRAQESGMIPLFDGKSLKGWKVRSGSASYKVEDGAIVGTTVPGSPNTFLCTLKEYSDFELEFEVKFDPELNSGVQFRSHAYERETVMPARGRDFTYPPDRVYGYQFEMSPAGTGKVYDEARRRIMIGEPYLAAVEIKANEWNKCRIIAQGDHIRTSVNGVAIADFHDDMDAGGFFGLQVHEIQEGEGPYSVRWRNIRIRELKPDQASLVDGRIEKAGSGYTFTEGPAVAPDGRVFFTDQPNDRIYVWDEKAGVSLWLEGTNRSNGLYFNEKGQLVACADLNNELVYFDENKKMHVIHGKYNGKLLNAPNDLWIDPRGGIYFSDPYYHRSWWKEGRGEEQDVRGVYYLDPEGGIVRVIDDFKQPNGLIGTPDGKTLYVADINDRKIWKYDILTDGLLANKTFFAPNGSDGMTIDNKGNVYLTSGKVWVYSPGGKLLEEIEVPEHPSNVCFGGKKGDTLFITARTSVYTAKMKVRGAD